MLVVVTTSGFGRRPRDSHTQRLAREGRRGPLVSGGGGGSHPLPTRRLEEGTRGLHRGLESGDGRRGIVDSFNCLLETHFRCGDDVHMQGFNLFIYLILFTDIRVRYDDGPLFTPPPPFFLPVFCAR